MATYVNDLRLKEIGTGESSGTWGSETNTNLELIGEALGFGTEAITTNADTHTTTVADGSTDPGRAMYLKYTGTLDSACTITIAPNTMSRMHFIENGTSGSQNIIISQGTGANVTIPAGDVKAVYLDGAGSGAAVTDAFASLNVVDLKVEDDLTVTDDVSIGGALTLTGNGDFNGDLDVDGTTNLDVVDIDGAVDMASTLQVDGAITSSAGATITVADNSDNLTLTSTDADGNVGPNLVLYRNSSSPADNDRVGSIAFQAKNDAAEDIDYFTNNVQIKDASDGTEDAAVEFNIMRAGSLTSMMQFDVTETVFNDNSLDTDFRVESDGNANMLFVDGGNNTVSVGGPPPESADTFCVTDAGSNSVNTRFVNTNADANGTKIVLHKNSTSPADDDELAEIAILGQDTGGNANTYASIRFFADDVTNGTEDGSITFSGLKAGAFTEHLRISPDGFIGIATTDPTAKLDVRGSVNSEHAVFTGGSNSGRGLSIQTAASGGQQDAGVIFDAQDTESGANPFIAFKAAGSEKMRILSDGDVIIGGTSLAADGSLSISPNHDDGACSVFFDRASTTATSDVLRFENGGSTVSQVSYNNTTVTYGTGSDARYKNILGEAKGLEIVNKLNPVNFEWKDGGEIQDGLIAQEVEKLIPHAVVVNEEGYYSMDYSKVVTPLIKAIQEQQEQIDALQSEINILKGV